MLGITGEKVVENPLTKSPAKLTLKHLTVPFFSNKPTWCFLASSIGSLADCENDGFEGPGSRSFVAQSIPLDILDLDAQLLGRHRKLFIAMCTVTCAHFLLHPSSWVMWYTRSIPQYNSCLFVTSPTGLLVLEGILKGSGPPCCIASLVRNVQGSALKGGRTKRWAFKGGGPRPGNIMLMKHHETRHPTRKKTKETRSPIAVICSMTVIRGIQLWTASWQGLYPHWSRS